MRHMKDVVVSINRSSAVLLLHNPFLPHGPMVALVVDVGTTGGVQTLTHKRRLSTNKLRAASAPRET
jgi:hypothetical protein